ncbi:MAG: carboxypeptidase-like regulatory domain-containing protein [Chitinophagales bacterium]
MTQSKLYSTILLCLFFSLNTIYASNNPLQSNSSTSNNETENAKLTLIGIVLDAYNIPLKDATIQLIEVNSSEEAEYITPEDGQFYFNLLPDKKYKISLLSKDKGVLTWKEISTINKLTPEVLHIVLQTATEDIVHR